MSTRKSTKAAAAATDQTLQAPRNGTWSHNARGVGAMADTLATWQRLAFDMSEADSRAGRELEKFSRADQDIEGGPYDRTLTSCHRFKWVEEAARAKAKALEALIVELEPQTIDEVLSMLVVFESALDTYVGNYCCVTTDTEASRDFKDLRRVILAMVRGLICAGASSPLLKHNTVRHDLETWEEALRTAECEAAAQLAEVSRGN
jgi:hypothetical protein